MVPAGTTTFDGAGGITLGANIVSTGLVNVVQSVVTLTGDRSITTTNSNITLDEVITNTDNDHVLTLTAGSGNITIDDNFGAPKLSSIVIFPEPAVRVRT